MKSINFKFFIIAISILFICCQNATEQSTTEPKLSSKKAITAFALTSPAVSGTVTESTHTIAVIVPFGTDVTALVPSITHTGANIIPASGTAQNFTSPVIYPVIAADSSTQTYTVSIYKRFTDDFNRADSSTVGNGWYEFEGNLGAAVTLTGNTVHFTSGSEAIQLSTITRDAVFSGNCTMVMTVNFSSSSSFQSVFFLLPAGLDPYTYNYGVNFYGGTVRIVKDLSSIAVSTALTGMTTGRDYLLTFTKVSSTLIVTAKDTVTNAEVSSSVIDNTYNNFDAICLWSSTFPNETFSIDNFMLQLP